MRKYGMHVVLCTNRESSSQNLWIDLYIMTLARVSCRKKGIPKKFHREKAIFFCQSQGMSEFSHQIFPWDLKDS
jgi:hypothetical protein